MTSAKTVADRLDGLFASIDAKDTDEFLGYLTEDATFRFGSAPAVTGHAAIREGVDGFFSSIAGSEHSLKNVITNGGLLVCEGEVTYDRHDGSNITLPFTNVFDVEGDRIANYRIYIDIAPLYPG